MKTTLTLLGFVLCQLCFSQIPQSNSKTLAQENKQNVLLDTNPKNILHINLDYKDELLVNGMMTHPDSLTKIVFLHISNLSGNSNAPEIDSVTIEGLGKRAVSRQVVIFNSERQTTYKYYALIQKHIIEAYNQARNQIALKEYNTSYQEILDENGLRLKNVKILLPLRLSENVLKK